jgi:transcriptional regulator of arginine metabolism
MYKEENMLSYLENKNKNKNKLLYAFKALLAEESLGSQKEISTAMSERGFANISQTKVSHLLITLGAFKVRNTHNKPVYKLPGIHLIPNKKQTINSVVLNIQHNKAQILVKTIAGGGTLISKIIENMPISIGVLGCIASNDSILVIPSNINNIDNTTQRIIAQLKMNWDYSID